MKRTAFTISREELRRLAEAADPNGYEAKYLFERVPVMPKRDAAFYAVARPHVVLSLLTELDAKDEQILRLQFEVNGLRQGKDLAEDNRIRLATAAKDDEIAQLFEDAAHNAKVALEALRENGDLKAEIAAIKAMLLEMGRQLGIARAALSQRGDAHNQPGDGDMTMGDS